MSLRNLLHRTPAASTARADRRALARALSRAVTPESRHELLVLDAIHR